MRPTCIKDAERAELQCLVDSFLLHGGKMSVVTDNHNKIHEPARRTRKQQVEWMRNHSRWANK